MINFVKRHNFRNAHFILCVLSIFAVSVFALTLTPDTIRMDQWRYVFLNLEPYYIFGFNIFDIAREHSSHVKLFYKGLFLFNAVYFDLSVHFEMVIGFFCLLLFSVLIVRHFHTVSLYNNDKKIAAIAPILLLPVIFSFNKLLAFTYSLMTVSVFVGWLAIFLYWHHIQSLTMRPRKTGDFVILVVLAIFLAIGIAGGRNPPVFIISILIAGAGLVVQKQQRKQNIIVFTTAVLTALICEFSYWRLVQFSAGPTFIAGGFERIVSNPVEAINYSLTLLANSAVYQTLLTKKGIGPDGTLIVGAVIAAFYAGAIYLYFRSKMYKLTFIPMAFIMFTALWCGSLLYARFGHRFGFPLRAAYANDSQLGIIGVVWIYLHVLLQTLRNTRLQAKKLKLALLAIPALFFLAIEPFNIQAAHRKQIYGHNFITKAIQKTLQDPTKVPSKLYCPAGRRCLRSIRILRDHNLSIFSNGKDEQSN